ncbi:calcium-binding protein [Paracoccus sp. MC1854]|uniref:calcium-binding protein n=1 Tax=Paracoccus sp. MC1854 TaxID=2760306 RepID=UPI002103C77A|nr:calcium-binding protein [Paracoccus sp. MC1854]
MARFRYVTTVTQGFVRSLTDLTLGRVGERTVLVGTTHAGGGVSIWDVAAADKLARVIASYDYQRRLSHLAEPQAILLDRPGGVSLLMGGLRGGADAVSRIGADGRRGARDSGIEGAALPSDLLHAGSFTLAGGQAVIYAARHDQPVFGLWRQRPDGRIEQAGTSAVPPKLPPDAQIDALVPLRLGGVDLLVAVSTRGNFVSSHVVLPDGRLAPGEFLGATRGTGFNGPRDIVALEVDGRHYLVVSSAYSSSLTTVRIVAGGGLVPVDHVIDERTTRFQKATVMEGVTIDGRAFVVVGGADDGLSLFTLTPDGRLIHLDTIADDARWALSDVSALAVRVMGGRIVVFAGSEVERGVSQFVIDPGRIGQTRQVGNGAHRGTDANDLLQAGMNTTRIEGGAGDDILIAGSRTIDLYGGAGADLFIPMRVAGRITIRDFQPGLDRIDMSMLGMIRSVSQLKFIPQSWGVRIRFGDTTIEVRTQNGRPLSAGDFDNGMFPVAHYQPPDVRSTVLGTAKGDLLRAGRGGSLVYGYGGNDTILGSDLEDFLQGGMGNDSIVGQDGEDTVWGGAGNDSIRGGGGNDLVLAGDGDDSVTGQDGDDLIGGETGNDRIQGGAGNDRLNGGAGNDHLSGGAGNDRIFGMAGNDTLLGDAGDDLMLDVSGDNLLVDLLGNNMMFAGGGNDRMQAGPGNDTLRPGAGNDSVTAGAGRDNVNAGPGDDTVLGEDGDDLLLGAAGRDVIHGGNGNDTIFGGDHDDRLFGDDGNDFLIGEGGNDSMTGGRGNDTLRGNVGHDSMHGGDGADRLIGGMGNDSLYGEAGNDLMLGEAGADLMMGGEGNDTIDGSWDDDQLFGDGGDDLLLGGHGADRLAGGQGSDTLKGGAGNDVLTGGNGADVLQGDDGLDLMTGGAGADVFIFDPVDSPPGTEDVIADFSPGVDRIDLSALRVAPVGGAPFSRGDKELRWFIHADTVRIEADTDSDGSADFALVLQGALAIGDTDFIL